MRNKMKEKLRDTGNYLKFLCKPIKLSKQENNKIILCGTPEYGNLGDHAISYATELFVSENVPNKQYYSLTENEINYNFRRIKQRISKQDILLLQGGGNMGDLYPDQVLIREKIIRNFPDNKIIVMPQTIFFKCSYEKLPEYYNHEKLILFARESTSYKIMLRLFDNKRVYLIPDIVLYLLGHNCMKSVTREGVLLCLRDDKEASDNSKLIREYIMNCLNKRDFKFEKFSTVLDHGIYNDERFENIQKVLDIFKNSFLVVTDRLHGMIFSAITRTPCIVLPTINYKVIDSYKWIQELNYITLCKNIYEFDDLISDVLNINENDKTNITLEDKFTTLKRCLIE